MDSKDKNVITIQELVENQLSNIFNEDVEMVGCSRTDAESMQMNTAFLL